MSQKNDHKKKLLFKLANILDNSWFKKSSLVAAIKNWHLQKFSQASPKIIQPMDFVQKLEKAGFNFLNLYA